MWVVDTKILNVEDTCQPLNINMSTPEYKCELLNIKVSTIEHKHELFSIE